MTFGKFHGFEDPFPVGAIMFWSGSPQELPPGWMICDGNNGTPDLRDKFVKGVPDGVTDPGSTGGQHNVTLTEANLPAHDHSITVTEVGDHTHTARPGGGNHSSGSSGKHPKDGTGKNVDHSGDHAHTYTTASEGSGSAIDNRPAYYEAAYIQRA